MTLLDRLARLSTLPDNERVPGHVVEYALILYFHGHYDRQEIINFFNITAPMEADFDKFKTKWDGFPTNNTGKFERQQWEADLIATIFGLQQKLVEPIKFNSILQLTLEV